MADIPPRLSDRQKFILAKLVESEQSQNERCEKRFRELRDEGYPRRAWRHLERIGLFEMPAAGLSRAVAREFGGLEFNPSSLPKEERRRRLKEQHQRELEEAESEEEREKLRERHAWVREYLEKSPGLPAGVKVREYTLTESHISTHSESLRRLEDRSLVERINERFGKRRSARHSRGDTTLVLPTDEGREVGEEILRRHADSRYSISFETLD